MKQFSKIMGYPPELVGRINSFIITEFDDSMTAEMQMRVLIKWIMKNIDLTNEMVEYLNEFIKNFDAKLYETVGDILVKWLNDGTLAEIINDVVFKELSEKLKNLKTNFINARDFGVIPIEEEPNYNSTNAFKNLLIMMKQNDLLGRKVIFPKGTILLYPMTFKGYNDLTFVGSGSNTHTQGVGGTMFKFIKNPSPDDECKNNEYGFMFSCNTNPNPEWKCTNIHLRDFMVHGSQEIEYGINGNFDIHMENIYALRFKLDGIVLEDYTYPATLRYVRSKWNGRHGFVVKGPNTTKYTFYDCDGSENEGNGYEIQGGATATFYSCLAQSNKKHGFNIHYINAYYLLTDYFLQNITFENCYTENNGTDKTHFGVNIQSDIETAKMTNTLRPQGIHFNGGACNAPSRSGTMRVDAVQGLYSDMINTVSPESVNDEKLSDGSYRVANFNKSGIRYPWHDFIGHRQEVNNTSVPILYHRGEETNFPRFQRGKRGRYMTHTFQRDNLPAGPGAVDMVCTSSFNLTNNNAVLLANAIPMATEGSVVGIHVSSTGVIPSNITFSLLKGTQRNNVTTWKPTQPNTQVPLVVGKDQKIGEKTFTNNDLTFNAGEFIGVRIFTTHGEIDPNQYHVTIVYEI